MEHSTIVVGKIDLLYNKIKSRKEENDNADSSDIHKSVEERAS
ncbi:MAG: hypothetical protein ACRDDH_18280 [Cetobacterium sp.]